MSAFTGTARLVVLAVRRDRVILPAWVLGMAIFIGTAAQWARRRRHDNLGLQPQREVGA